MNYSTEIESEQQIRLDALLFLSFSDDSLN